MHNSVKYSFNRSPWSRFLLLTLGILVTPIALPVVTPMDSAYGETSSHQQLNFPIKNSLSPITEVSLENAKENVPAEVTTILSQVDTAANNRDTAGLTLFYTADFTNSDSLSRDLLLDALANLWKRYPSLNYRTEVLSWSYREGGFVLETLTTITGVTEQDGTTTRFESKLRSRQTIENLRISTQEILAERTQVTIGNNPPTVSINLPEQVRVGQQYNFDAIIQEPIGDNLVLGTALEEPVNRDRYINPAELDLTLLQAGGIFKIGRAPLRPEPRWISAVLIRGGGTTVITQRLRVVD